MDREPFDCIDSFRFSSYGTRKMKLGAVWFSLTALIVLSNSVEAFTVELLPSEKLCFHEQLVRGERLLVGFQVQDGPNFEADFTVFHELRSIHQ